MAQIWRLCGLTQGPTNFKIPHWFIISYRPKFGAVSFPWKPRNVMNVSAIFLGSQIPLNVSVILRLSVFKDDSYFYLILRVIIYCTHDDAQKQTLCASHLPNATLHSCLVAYFSVKKISSREANWSRNSPNFMEPKGSLPHLQVPAICPYPETDQFSPCPLYHCLGRTKGPAQKIYTQTD